MIPITETTTTKSNTTAVNPPKKRSRSTIYDSAKSTYDAAYFCLKRLENLSLPQSMNRITTNGNVKVFLVKKGLISEVNPENNLREEYLTYKYYSINPKGQYYIKRYESFKELIS
jgi:hypothetical protein